jgi:DNA polymerase-1
MLTTMPSCQLSICMLTALLPGSLPLIHCSCLQDGMPGKDVLLPPVEEIQRDPALRSRWIRYSTYDAESTWHLRVALESRLRARPWVSGLNMWDFYQRWMAPFGECLTDMERAGIMVNKAYLHEAEKQATADREAAEKRFL